MSFAGPGATRAEVVQQRLGRRRPDHAEHRHQREQHREQREDAEVRQRGRPGRELVLAELLERALEDRRPGLLREVGRLVGDVAGRRRLRGACGLGHAPAYPRRAAAEGSLSGSEPARRVAARGRSRQCSSAFSCRPSSAACSSPCSPRPSRALPRIHCDASALRVTLAGAQTVEPLTANRGAAECAATEAGGALPATPLPVTGGTLFARTTFTAGDPLSQVAGASAGLADLAVATPPALLPALDLSALPGRRRARRARDRDRRPAPGAERADRPRGPVAAGQRRHRGGERALPRRQPRPGRARRGSARSPCSA